MATGIVNWRKNEIKVIEAAIGKRIVLCFVGALPPLMANLNLFDTAVNASESRFWII